jgi:hypothetical protein
MAHTIHKFPLHITDEQLIAMPAESQPLHAGIDPGGKPCLWCEVDTDSPETIQRKIFVVGTGNPIPDEASVHLGSFVAVPFVWHVFGVDDSSESA